MKRLREATLLLRLVAGGMVLVLAHGAGAQDKLTGVIKADGSSTVFLISEAMASNFSKLHPDVKISVAFSGTGGGFKRFAAGETDISNASRPIKPAEADKCKQNGITYTELQVAWDGLAVIIHPENKWAKRLTVDQLKTIWHPKTAPKKWSDVDPSWPNEDMKLYGPDSDSGTLDFFTEVINGKEKEIRTDYTPSANDDTTINGVARNKYAMGFLGVAYYEQNKGKVEVVAVMNPKSKNYVVPDQKTVLDKSYAPLSRPLYIYVKNSSLKRPEVREFVSYHLRNEAIVRGTGYVPLNNKQGSIERKKLDEALKTLE